MFIELFVNVFIFLWPINFFLSFFQHKITYVIHFAAIKAVGESMQFPLNYYKNNVIGTINLVEVSTPPPPTRHQPGGGQSEFNILRIWFFFFNLHFF